MYCRFPRYLYDGKVDSEVRLKWHKGDRKTVSPFPYASLKEGPRFVTDLMRATIAYMPHTSCRIDLDASDGGVLRDGGGGG